jgi:hypothetical protein
MATNPKPLRKIEKQKVNKIRQYMKPVSERGGEGHMKAKNTIGIA